MTRVANEERRVLLDLHETVPIFAKLVEKWNHG